MNAAKLVFLDIDTQVDFMLPTGALYVPGAETIIPNLQRLMRFAAGQGLLVLSSADAHAPDDPSFAQWPPHCVAGTPGQQRIAATQMPEPLLLPNRPGAFQPPAPAAGQVILEKVDYDVSSNPNFDSLLQALGPSRFAVFGVATGYCVQASALALRRRGYAVTIVTDAVRGITEERQQTALRALAEAGVAFASTDEVVAPSDDGLMHVPSRYSLGETGERLEAAVQAHGLRLFARIDHAAAAAGAGLAMPPTEVFLIGNPALGTPLMLAAPALAIDLPFKVLLWQDARGQVQLTCNSPAWLARRHSLPPQLAERLQGIARLLREVAE